MPITADLYKVKIIVRIFINCCYTFTTRFVSDVRCLKGLGKFKLLLTEKSVKRTTPRSVASETYLKEPIEIIAPKSFDLYS